MSSVWWAALWSAVAATVVGGVVVSTNSARFQRRVDREVDAMVAGAAEGSRLDWQVLDNLPAPFKRYLSKAIGSRQRTIRTAHVTLGGSFRPALNGRWYPIASEEYLTADPPAFIWWGRVRLAPGLWIEARDRSIGGTGNMLVMAESTLTLADASGSEQDQGALLRLLGELVWLPTAYLDERYVRWSALDQQRARATLAVHAREVSAVFHFGEDDLPIRFTGDRFRDVGGGKSELTPFMGEYGDYRQVDGMFIPHRLVASWAIERVAQPYADFRVSRFALKDPAGTNFYRAAGE